MKYSLIAASLLPTFSSGKWSLTWEYCTKSSDCYNTAEECCTMSKVDATSGQVENALVCGLRRTDPTVNTVTTAQGITFASFPNSGFPTK